MGRILYQLACENKHFVGMYCRFWLKVKDTFHPVKYETTCCVAFKHFCIST